MVGVEAQTYYEGDGGGMDNRYNSYEPTTSYGSDDKKYNSYEPTTSYGSDDKKYNSYEPTTSYGSDDKKYQKTYGKDNSYDKSEYQPSYKPDYKPAEYPSYVKDDRDKFKDSSSKSVSTNKFNCINDNININGVNSGNISIGNKGQGYLGPNSYGGYYDGYNNNQDKGFDCIINNNNTNTNIGGSNVTDSDVTDTCEECFTQNLNQSQFTALLNTLEGPGINIIIGGQSIIVEDLQELCIRLADAATIPELFTALSSIALQVGIQLDNKSSIALIRCLAEALGIEISVPC